MTQILSVMTREYVLLASDRRLIYADGSKIGQVYDDDTCKLVSLCGTTGIGYTGLGRINGQPTHEWIAETLADACVHDAIHGSQIVRDQATNVFGKMPGAVRCHTFLLVGWNISGIPPTLRPFHCLVTNTHNASGQVAKGSLSSFSSFVRFLTEGEESYGHLLGQALGTKRAASLRRNIHRLVERKIGPREMLRLLVDEIIYSSLTYPNVGAKILGFSIPKSAVVTSLETGRSVMLASQPNAEVTTFTYFEKGFRELQQYGPTTVCGAVAVTGVKTQNDPSRDFQSSEFRILAWPKPEN